MAAPGTAFGLQLAALLCAAAADAPSAALPAPVRTVLAKGIVANAAGAPLHMRLRRVEVAPGRTAPAPGAEGIVYVLSAGPLVVATAGKRTVVAPGEALFLPGNPQATFEAAENRPVAFLHVLLGPIAELDRVGDGAPATVTDLYSTPVPLAGLGSGPLAFDLTRVTFPPHMPPNPPHHRSGDALYWVLSGTGEFTAGGETVPRPPGTAHFEPSGLIHRWANPGDSPLVFLVANVTQEGTPAIVFDAPAASR